MKTLFTLLLFSAIILEYKTVTVIESCADSGRCRVYFDDESTDLLFNPYIGMKVEK
jgi:hypothetical protein